MKRNLEIDLFALPTELYWKGNGVKKGELFQSCRITPLLASSYDKMLVVTFRTHVQVI